MQTQDLQLLKIDLERADPTNDALFYDLLKRTVSSLGLFIADIAKALGVEAAEVESWLDGNTTPIIPLRPWVYKYLTKQIISHGEVVSYHATDEYGHKYLFEDATADKFASIANQIAKCGKLLDRVQLSFLPPQMRLSFWVDGTHKEDATCIEELHYLITGLGGYPEVRISSGQSALVIPLSKKERGHTKHSFSMGLQHCFVLNDGCALKVGGHCVCPCCLIEKRQALPRKVAI